MEKIQTIPRWIIVLAIFMLCICCMQILKKCLKIENFSDQGSAKVTVTNYWANWCGYSTSFTDPIKKNLQWDLFKKALNDDNTKQAFAQDFDCGADTSKATDDAEKNVMQDGINKCKAAGVPGYPSVVITYKDKAGNDQTVNYNGPRTKADLDTEVTKILAELA